MQLMTIMPKKKPKARGPKGPPKEKQPEHQPPAIEHRESILAIRCRPDFKGWAADFAKAERVTLTILVELGLVELAKRRGFRLPPER
jgi:hypothetical protein